jgi:predicted enzyme related to lactoylglutathione lyase
VTARPATTRAAGEFCWIDLKTRDVPATAAFFSAALGWTFAVDPDDWRQATKIAIDGHWVGGVSDLASPIYPPDTSPHIASYLAVDDVDARTAAARQAGAEVVVPPSDVADQGRLAAVVDPFGAGIALWQAAAFGGWTHELGTPSTPVRMVHVGDRPAEARGFYERVLGLRAGTAGFAAGPAATWEVAVGVPDLTVVAQRAGTSTWVADSTQLHLTDPQGLRLVVVRA